MKSFVFQPVMTQKQQIYPFLTDYPLKFSQTLWQNLPGTQKNTRIMHQIWCIPFLMSVNTLAKWIPRNLGIPRNSNLFPDMQISKIEKPWNFWEYLGISENTYGNFWEFLGIPRNSNFEGELSLEFVGIFGNPKRY